MSRDARSAWEITRIRSVLESEAIGSNQSERLAKAIVAALVLPQSAPDEAALQRAASATLPEGPCLVCGLLGMNKTMHGYLCSTHAIEFERYLRSVSR